MIVLLPNVFRPTPSAWAAAWGTMTLPPGYGSDAIELGQHFELTRLGVNLGRLPPGHRGGPLHHHLFEEEIFMVLEGQLVVRELASGAERYREYTLRQGELVAYPAGTGLSHQSRNDSSTPVRTLNLSDRWFDHEVALYPDSGKTLLRGVEALGAFATDRPATEHLAAARGAADARGVDPVELADRPAWVQGLDTVAERDLGAGVFGRPLSRTAGAQRVFVNRDRLTPGSVSGPMHWHTADEELLIVLEGTPTLCQLRTGVEERMQLVPHDVVCWKPGDRVAHQLRAEGDHDVVVLVVGTDRPEDITVFPETGQMFVRALGQRGTLDAAGYWDGEGG